MPINHSVADLTALTAIGASSVRIDGYLKLVLDPGSNEPPAWYVYLQSSPDDALGNIIAVPDDAPTTGRWIKQGQLYHYATEIPAGAPPLQGIQWIASLSTPTRKVCFVSIGTSSVADWIPFGNETVVDYGSPEFTPDYIGQQYHDTSGDLFYVAEGTSGSADWVAVGAASGGGGS